MVFKALALLLGTYSCSVQRLRARRGAAAALSRAGRAQHPLDDLVDSDEARTQHAAEVWARDQSLGRKPSKTMLEPKMGPYRLGFVACGHDS